MKTTTLRKLSLAGLAVSALAASSPLWARDRDDDRYYPRHAAYERDHRYYAEHDRRHFEPRRALVVERPVYLERPVVVYRDAPQPYYGNVPDDRTLAAVAIGTAVGTILR
jgi:hypothetical protein